MTTEDTPRRGRPRKADADRAILTATLELVAEVGISDFRVEDVAVRAGVGKSAIYRRYDTKDALVAAAITALVSEITVPDTGSTGDDLIALMTEAVAVSVPGRSSGGRLACGWLTSSRTAASAAGIANSRFT
jgi:AcrR family transcriptional regulator